MIRGLVLRGSRNVFTLRAETGGELECRIKGKILKGVEGCHNPLAPGDHVLAEEDPARPGKGLIITLEERRNLLSRINQKGLDRRGTGASQLLAANVDLALCVATPASPPWRPRFLDRLLLQADAAGIEALIICNKWELAGDDPDVDERLEDYRRIGYEVLRVSVHTGLGMNALKERLAGKRSVLAGQSGVGKSSIINAVLGEARLRVGGLNEKYDRGNHTTAMSALLEFPGGAGGLIDTPGIRRLMPDGIAPEDLLVSLREFAPLAGKCSFGLSCSHQSEPGCKVLEAVAAGFIHEDRYQSFLRIREELQSPGGTGANPYR